MVFNKTSVLAFVMLLSACSQSPLENNEITNNMKIQVTSIKEKGKLMSEVSDTQTVNKIMSLLETKKPMMEKMLPIFTMEITITENNSTQVWLFAKPKYLRLKSSKNTQIYTLEKYDELTRLMLD